MVEKTIFFKQFIFILSFIKYFWIHSEKLSIISQKGESQDWGNKKMKYAKFSENEYFSPSDKHTLPSDKHTLVF